MPDVKCTWLFNGGNLLTDEKVWGFSETWYSGLEGVALVAAMDNLSDQRRLILARDVKIVGYRIGQANGRSYVIRKSFSAPRENDYSNMPVDSALCQVAVDGAPAIKRFWLHDLPDDWVNVAQIVAARKRQIRAVIDAYSVFGFKVRTTNQAAATANILSITDAGVVTTVQAHGLVANQLVSFLSCRDINNRPIRGQWIVQAPITANTFTVAGWGGNVVARRGRVRVVNYSILPALSLGDRGIISGGSRKVGRPFFQSRGRVPNRR